VISILRAHPELSDITLTRGLAVAAEQVRAQGIEVPDLAEVEDFVVRRFEQQLLDAGHDHRHVAAVLPLASAPAAAEATLREIEQRVGDKDFAALVAALQRVRRIVPAGAPSSYDPAVLTEPAEVALHQALVSVRAGLRDVSLAEFVLAAGALTAPVNTFFDDILVMAEDEGIRAARLGLLATIRDLAAPVLDWQALGTSFAAE
jgi:glycyl-tRNA synthetase